MRPGNETIYVIYTEYDPCLLLYMASTFHQCLALLCSVVALHEMYCVVSPYCNHTAFDRHVAYVMHQQTAFC